MSCRQATTFSQALLCAMCCTYFHQDLLFCISRRPPMQMRGAGGALGAVGTCERPSLIPELGPCTSRAEGTGNSAEPLDFNRGTSPCCILTPTSVHPLPPSAPVLLPSGITVHAVYPVAGCAVFSPRLFPGLRMCICVFPCRRRGASVKVIRNAIQVGAKHQAKVPPLLQQQQPDPRESRFLTQPVFEPPQVLQGPSGSSSDDGGSGSGCSNPALTELAPGQFKRMYETAGRGEARRRLLAEWISKSDAALGPEVVQVRREGEACTGQCSRHAAGACCCRCLNVWLLLLLARALQCSSPICSQTTNPNTTPVFAMPPPSSCRPAYHPQALGMARLGAKLLADWQVHDQLLFALGLLDTKYRWAACSPLSCQMENV